MNKKKYILSWMDLGYTGEANQKYEDYSYEVNIDSIEHGLYLIDHLCKMFDLVQYGTDMKITSRYSGAIHIFTKKEEDTDQIFTINWY